MSRTLANEAKKLNSRCRMERPRTLPFLLFMTDPRAGDPVAVAERLPSGSGIVLRHYEALEREALGRQLASVCRARRLTFLVARDWRLAVRLGADGIHLPEWMARRSILAPILQWRATGRLLTIAVHNRLALARAESIGADAAVVSPVFPTRSHPGGATLGPGGFSRLVRESHLPAFALGGIDATSVRLLGATGAYGIAAVAALATPGR